MTRRENKDTRFSSMAGRLGVVTLYSNKMAYTKEKKSFHPVRHFRLSQENMDWLEKIKKGTWSNTFNNIRTLCGKKMTNAGGVTDTSIKVRPRVES